MTFEYWRNKKRGIEIRKRNQPRHIVHGPGWDDDPDLDVPFQVPVESEPFGTLIVDLERPPQSNHTDDVLRWAVVLLVCAGIALFVVYVAATSQIAVCVPVGAQ